MAKSENKKMVLMIASFVVVIGAGLWYYNYNKKKKAGELTA